MLKRTAFLVLMLVFGITAFMAYRMTAIQFDYDFEKFFPEDDEETQFFFDYRKKFESDNDYVLVGIVREKGIFDSAFLHQVDRITNDFEKVTNIRQVVSLTNYTELIKSSLGPAVFEVPAIHLNNTKLYKSDSTRIFNSQQLVGTLLNKNATSVSLLLLTEEYISKAASDSLAKAIDSIIANYNFEETHVAGRSTGQSYYVHLMQSELLFFTFTSFILVVVFLGLSFRTLWGIVVPITVVVFSAIWIVGFMELLGEGINLVLTILPTIIFVVGMSDVVHVISKYVEELRSGTEKVPALIATYKEVARATLLTSVTTSIGFLTLLMSPIEPVRDFGWFTAIGVMFAFVLAFTLLPAVLLLSPVPKIANTKHISSIWQRLLRKMFVFVLRKPKWIIGTTIIVLVLAIIGATQLRINNFLLEDLEDDNELKQEFVFFEKEYAGVRPFEMAILVDTQLTSTRVDLRVLQEMEKMETHLITNYNLGFVVSPITLVKTLNKNTHGGAMSYYKLPKDQTELNKLIKLLDKFNSTAIMDKFITPNGDIYRVSGKLPDLGSYYYKQRNLELANFYRTEVDTNLFNYQLTGTAVLIDKNNGSLSFGLVIGLLISFSAIALIVGLMFYDWRMIIISLIPNFLPLLFIAGIMGYLAIDLKVSTSMIFTIAFGIAVDDTIHFISKLRLELLKNKSVLYAIKRTYLTTGRAIIYTSIILSGGFLTLIFSSFLGTYYIGLLVGLTLIFAVLADLFLLPVLLIYFYKRR